MMRHVHFNLQEKFECTKKWVRLEFWGTISSKMYAIIEDVNRKSPKTPRCEGGKMKILLKEIPKSTKIFKATCKNCHKTIHSVGFMENSKCDGVTVVCKFCGQTYSITVY